jgi:hypothetical protein
MLRTNLQLFADDEVDEIDEIDLEEDVEDVEDLTEEEPEGDVTEEEPEVEPEKPKKDKVTAAIIREKQANKALRDELYAFRKREADREQADRDRQLRQRLIDDGLTEQEADDRVSDRREREELKRELQSIKYGQQADKLASRYPTIHEHLDGFIAIVEASKGKLTLAELCKAKLDEATSHEIRTKAEQEALLTRQKAKDKQIKTGDVKTDSPVKLSSDDERILSNINKKKQQQGLPLMTRKQYLELSM